MENIMIDLDALEKAATNNSGEKMEPKELLQMFFETGVLMQKKKVNRISAIRNTVAEKIFWLYNSFRK